jgi:hypothetical protein
MPFWPFRSTGDHIAELQKLRGATVAEAPSAYDGGDIRVSADLSSNNVRVDVGLFHFTMSRKTAFEFAKQVDGAADALGPDSSKVDESIDLTAEIDGKEAGDG